MDDYIVIILMLLFAGIGALGKAKKKKRMVKPQGANPPASFWDLIQGPTVPQQEEMAGYDVPGHTEENGFDEDFRETVTPDPEYSFTAKNEGISTIDDAPKTKRKKLKQIGGFSLRKAVIYSEILNRKYT